MSSVFQQGNLLRILGREPEAAAARQFRLAILGTPRSGNTWLRRMLRRILVLDQVLADRPQDIDWDRLAPRVIIQLHAHADAEFRERLRHYSIHPIVLARHPLDVLLSILQFSQHTRETRYWLDGEEGDETLLAQASPVSPEFLSYATSRRAAALLSLTRQWWDLPGICRVRYEDLLEDTVGTLHCICEALQCRPRGSIRFAVQHNRLKRQQRRSSNNHFWKGQAGHWRSLIPADLAREIAAFHAANFDAFGYRCDPDEELTPETAFENWQQSQLPATDEPRSLVDALTSPIRWASRLLGRGDSSSASRRPAA